MTYSLEARCDFETRAKVDLRKRGSSVYFECPFFRPIGLSYRIGDGDLKDWEWGQPCPDDLREHIERGGTIRAFNAVFERGCFNWLADNCGWPRPAIDRYYCTAAEASALGLPRSLEGVGTVLHLKTQKDKEGAALIKLFSIPRKPKPGEDPSGTYFNEPEDFPKECARFIEYRRDDVLTEEAAADRLIPLSAYEHNVYVMDQKINDRGIRVDRRSIISAVRLAEKTKMKLDRQMKSLTGGRVSKCSEVAKLLDWIKSRGVEIEALAKADILDILDATDLPPDVRTALSLRQQAAKASVSKLTAMLNRACRDGRVKHSFIYHRASTGRWQNVGVNFANLPRPRKVYEEAGLDPAQLFEAFRLEDPDLLEALYGPELGRPLDLISDAIRGFLIAAPGHDIIQADYSSIEGCVIAWLAGEEWKVQAMHELFADPTLPDLYRRTAAQIMNMTTDVITKKHPLRQSVGKVSELALGYQGSVSAFYSMSRLYGVELDQLFPPVWENASEEMKEKAQQRYANAYKRGGSRAREMSREAWMACWLIVQGWRATNAAITKLWGDQERAARFAVDTPGVVIDAGKLRYVVDHGYLFCQLPSKRCLAYASPKLSDQVWAELLCDDGTWSAPEVMLREQAEMLAVKGKARIKGETSPTVTVLGVDKSGRKMRRDQLYGGLLAQNATQAIARDILVNGMLKAEEAGYPIIGHVYDEMFAEIPAGTGDVKAFEKIICEYPAWAEGLPLQADGWSAKRYRK